jgi:hypothetical protein
VDELQAFFVGRTLAAASTSTMPGRKRDAPVSKSSSSSLRGVLLSSALVNESTNCFRTSPNSSIISSHSASLRVKSPFIFSISDDIRFGTSTKSFFKMDGGRAVGD